MAEVRCATKQCSAAQKIPNLPTDVQSFVEQRDGCDHFRGEPWPEGDEPILKRRRDFISKNIHDLCTGTDKRLADLRKEYQRDQIITKFLEGYEAHIESR